MAALVPRWLGWVVAVETVQPAKPNIYTIWPSTDKVYTHMEYGIRSCRYSPNDFIE